MATLHDLAHFDPARKLMLKFSEFSRELEQQAAQTAKTVREEELRAGYAKRREPPEPDCAA